MNNKNLIQKSFSKTKLYIMIGLLATQIACNDDNDEAPLPQVQVQTFSETDKNFMVKTGYGNRAEIELGQLAAAKGTRDSIKTFGQLMVNEHTLAQNDLKALASNKNVNIPDTLDATHKALKQQLDTLTGAAFDSVYINSQVVDHQLTRQDFQTEINSGQDPNVKGYANKFLPHIEMHLQKAVGIKDSLNY